MSAAGISRRSLRLVRAFLAVQSAVAAATAVALLALPARLTSGPAMTTVYEMAPRAVWGLVFAFLAVVSATVFAWPHGWRHVMVVVITVHTAWALGLTLPLFFADQANLLTPLAWGSVVGSAAVIANHAGDERP